MDINSVSRRFALLSGVDGDELEELMPLIEDSVAYVGSLLKKNVDTRENSTLLCAAAAAYACYKWSLVNAGRNITSFAAGDMRVTADSSDTENSAYRLWINSLSEISPLTEDGGFFFKGVRV